MQPGAGSSISMTTAAGASYQSIGGTFLATPISGGMQLSTPA